MNPQTATEARAAVVGGPGFRVTLDGTGESFDVRPGEAILGAARRAGLWLPFECGWGSCSRCKATLVDGEVEYLFPEAPAIDARDQRRRRYLLCQTTPSTDVTIRTMGVERRPPVERPTVDLVARLVRRADLAPGIAEFVFALQDEAGLPAVADFRPGQYAILQIDDGLRRCYSMASTPGTDEAHFIIKRYDGHVGSTRMFALQPGAMLPIELPYGDMWLRDNDRPVVMIAGGTGISAILSMARSIADDPQWADRVVHVLYGAGTRAELVCWDELEDLTEHHARQLHGALVHAPDDWTGSHGFVTTMLSSLLEAEIAQDQGLHEAEVYLAGPPPMVQAVQGTLNEQGIQLDRIHVDSFG